MIITRLSAKRIIGLAFQAFAMTALMLYAAPPAFGQDQATTTTQPANVSPATQPTDTAERIASEITIETIQARLAQIESGAELPEITRTEVLGLYKQALEQINLTENLAKQIADYENGRQQAPALLDQLRKSQEQAVTQPAKEPPFTAPSDDELNTLPNSQLEELTNRVSAQLKRSQDEAKKLDDEANKLDDEAKTRQQRKTLIPNLLSDAKKRLEKFNTDLSAPPASGVAPQLAQARRTLLVAQKRAVEQEINAYEEELSFYDARSNLLAARREEAKRKVDLAQKNVSAQEAIVSNLRKTLLSRQKQQTEEELQSAPRAVQELAEYNAKLIAELEQIDAQIDELEAKSKTVKDRTATLAKNFEFLQKNIEHTDTANLGPLMREYREELVSLRSYEADLRLLQKKQAQARLDSWALEEKWLTPIATQIAESLEELAQSEEVIDEQPFKPKITELLQARRTYLEQSSKLFNDYESRLRDLIFDEDTLLTKVREFSEFVEEHILWIRSADPIYTIRTPSNMYAMLLAFPNLALRIVNDTLGQLPLYVLAGVLIGGLLAIRGKLYRVLHNISTRVTKAHTDSYRLTLLAFVYSTLLSLPWAAILVFIAWRIDTLPELTERSLYNFEQALAYGLRSAAIVMLITVFIRNICRPQGLAQAHFRWDATAVRLIRKNLFWLTIILVPATVIVYGTQRHAEIVWRNSFGRLSFIVGMLALAVFAQIICRPQSILVVNQLRKNRSGWIYQLRHVWYAAAVALPLILAVASMLGYYYTAIIFAQQFVSTVLLAIGLILLHAMMIRWLFVAQRSLAIEQVKKRKAAAAEEKSSDERSVAEVSEIEDKKLDIVSIGAQTKTLLRSTMALALLIGLWMIWGHMLGALTFMQKVQVGSYTIEATAQSTGEATTQLPPTVEYITLANVVMAIIVVAASSILAKNIPGLLEITILQKLPLDMGGRYAFTTLVRYVIIVIGIIITFSSIGIGWSKVQWLIAAMTVGLGFGLQEIFANFISGLMLLFERPIRIGDTVTVGDVSGTVSKIRIRATTITGWDRKELVIPNKEFITGQIVNWTLSDSTLRIILPVGIAYGSDTKKVREVLYAIAKAHPHVVDDPEPSVLFAGFGDSALNFELRVYIEKIEHYLSTMDELNETIDQEFRKAGIEIAFPQRDIHVRSIQAQLPMINQDTKKE